MRQRAVDSREAILDLAAQVLSEIGECELSDAVAKCRVPRMDGRSNLHPATKTGEGWHVNYRSQQVMPESGHVFLRLR